MPTIPQLERRTINPQTRIATVDPRGAAALGRSVGQGIEDVRGAYKDAQDKSDRYELADAASKFSILKNQQDNAYDEGDLEYSTIPLRYELNVDEGLSEIAGGISNPELRNMFLLENKPKVAAGTERMKNVAFGVETQVQRANVNSRLNGLREVILGDNDKDRSDAIKNVKDVLSAAMGKGYYTPEEFVNIEKAFTVDAAIGWVDTLPINKQRDALNSPMSVENIPDDIRQKKLRALEGAEVLEQAQQIARKLLNSDLSPEQIRKESLKYSGDLYEEVKRQIGAEETITKKNKLNADQTFHSNYYMNVLRQEDGFKLEDLLAEKPEAFKGLSYEQKSSLIRAAQGVVKGSARTASKPVTIDELHRLKAEADEGRGSYEDLRKEYLRAVAEGELTPTHIDRWSQISNEGIVPDAYKEPFTTIQMVDQKLFAQGVKKSEDRLLVRDKIDKWMGEEYTRLNKQPEPTAVNKRIDELIKEVTVPTAWFMRDDKKRQYELDSKDIESLATTFESAPEKLELETFKTMSKEFLRDQEEDPDLRFKTVGITLKRVDELDLTEQEELVKYIQKNDPEIFDRVINSINRSGRSMTPELVMGTLSGVFNGPE
jgi:hypothetical protein